MGVYIPGMKIPGSCSECLDIGWQYVFECRLDDSEEGKRLVSCPLVPVPEHGRLIDADALEDLVIALRRDAIHAYEWTGKSGEWSTRIAERERFAVTIEDAPTIIPADKEGEG